MKESKLNNMKTNNAVKKTIGVLGGMGPLATVDLVEKIIKNTAATSDQEHLHVIVDINTAIPDRTSALLQGGKDPVPEMLKSVERLERAQVDFIIMPCNTAHAFLPRLKNTTSIPFLSMIDATVAKLNTDGVQKVAVLGTEGTIKSQIYEAPLKNSGIDCLPLKAAEQQSVMTLIYEVIKAGVRAEHPEIYQQLIDSLVARGAERILLACTELPIAVKEYAFKGPFLDPTVVLARAAVLAAGGELSDLNS